MSGATPVFFSPAWVSDAQATVSPWPSVQLSGAAVSRNSVNRLVVPEPSERCTTVMSVSGRSASGLSPAISGSFQVVTSRWKLSASVAALSCRSSTPDRL